MERLDLRLVEYFIAAAEELHFGRAAERLHIAQPSLSQQIRRLETQLGVTLLERDSRNVQLTSAGETLLREGRKIVSQAQHVIHTTRAASSGRLTVGFYGSAAALLPGVLRAFNQHHPAFDVCVRELLLGSIDEILDGTVNLAFTRLLPKQTELEVEMLTQEARLVALTIAHPLAAREAVTYADLRDESFVVNPVVPEPGTPARWTAEQRRHGLSGRVAAEASSVQEILALVAAGSGVCLVPAVVAQHYPRTDIAYVPVSDAEPAVVSLAWRRGQLTAAAQAFIQTAQDFADINLRADARDQGAQ